MSTFTKIFVTEKGSCKFIFSKVEGDRPKYFVQVEDHATIISTFDIKQDKLGAWKIVEPAPCFIVNVEGRIAAAIEHYLMANTPIVRSLN